MRDSMALWKITLLAVCLVMAEGLSLAEDTQLEENNTKEDIATLSVRELEKRLNEVNSRISELTTEEEYLKTEPPDMGYDSGEVERTGIGYEWEPPSRLLNPRAGHEMKKDVHRLRLLKKDIELELDERDLEAKEGKGE